ncbi:MAG: M10 family metallopeptidase C-terminal domain-containing protein [Roseomonas sp.]|nr:M10 family metallopeptidase C-terminal domain-containing protein [Roseomonas sp.]MCA3331405.1 M10 family metallopeptidase C-terminal domain-containing protein [Roseomonas sp.]MCA3336878.1 M10 family metallopeptidase C-terminal domain-containing protein [Roseomonas sp.]MCA3355792.1 M10 family metallopeptidase C-terminal domain-containing protein [Roseomonas sp.]MCA3386512.1 M10 family metallopeptidase C-terminal domain-containing protein [Roseomonas sp.]
MTLAAKNGEAQLNTTLTGTPATIGLQSLSNGNYLLRFESPEGGANGTEIRNRVFSVDTNGNLTPVSINSSTNDFLVNTTTSGDQTGIRTNRLADGRLLEVWQSTDTGDGSGTAIRARFSASDGTPTGTDFVFNITTTGDQRSPIILGFNDGRRLVWWHSFESGPTDTIRGRWVDHNGVLGASDFVITTLPDTSVPGFTLALLADQSVVAVYGGTGAGDGSGSGIQATRITSLGGALFPAAGVPNELTLPPVLASPFDDPLPEYDWATAAAQISRNITSSNQAFTAGLGNPLTMSFAFRDSSTNMPPMTTGASGFSRFTDTQISAALYAMQQWQDVANITLTRVQDPGSQYSNNAQLTLWNYTGATSGSGPANASGYGQWRSASGTWQNFVYLNEQKTLATAPTSENGGLEFYMHEIGHALGLSHPGPYNIGGTGTYTAYAQDAIFFEDSEQYSLMSYFNGNTTHAFLGSANSTTPMLYDIGAIQRLYGANMTTRTGDNIYGFNANAGQAFSITLPNQQTVFSVWDAGGRDVFDFSGYSQTQWINLNEEAFSSVGGLRNNISIARSVTIEDAYGGSGADSMLGSAAANLLRGNAGADSLDGASGNDTLEGGDGNDYYFSVTSADRITEAAGGGADTLIANSSLSMPENIEVAIIASGALGVSLTGGIGNEIIIGNEVSNIISGGAGDDTLNGIAGNDQIIGGEGNDLIIAGDGAQFLDGGPGDDVIMIGNTDLATLLALFGPS